MGCTLLRIGETTITAQGTHWRYAAADEVSAEDRKPKLSFKEAVVLMKDRPVELHWEQPLLRVTSLLPVRYSVQCDTHGVAYREGCLCR